MDRIEEAALIIIGLGLATVMMVRGCGRGENDRTDGAGKDPSQAKLEDNRDAELRRNEAQRQLAVADVNNIAIAIRMFEMDYGRLPVESAKQDSVSDYEVDTSEGAIVAALMGRDEDINPRGVIYLESDCDDGEEGYLDPWGRGYIVRMDTNFNGYVAKWPNPVTADGPGVSRVRAVALVVSLGADGEKGTDLDIVSSHH